MRRLSDQAGSALISAMMLLAMMMGIGLAAYSVVDSNERLATGERQREVSFNFSEQLLDAQVFKLSRGWPGRIGVFRRTTFAYPAACTTGVSDDRCPNGSELAGRFGGPDFLAGAAWTTEVRDNPSPNLNYYDDAVTRTAPCEGTTTAPCTYDANDDGRLWVRAQATIHGKRRTLVGLVRVEEVTEQMPTSVLVAGKFETTNNGRKVIVDTKGSASAAAPVQVRCQVRQPSCLAYEADKDQVAPDTTQLGYNGGNALSDEAIDRLRQRAIADGTYYASGCPVNPSGELVFVETGNCSYNNSAGPCCNSAASPGVFIVNNGTLALNGNIVFHGLVYMPNRGNNSGWVVTLGGTAAIQGAVSIDGPGGLSAGSSSVNVVYDPNVFNKVKGHANAGIIQNTWREITPAS